tara:strand:- start:7543 stop:8610 length:1068 start_codon:yes stop_codon:yes gene_type:complete
MSQEQSEFMATMQAYVERGDEGITMSWDDVNRPMIRHWAQAMGDNNPVYTDADFAATTRHGGLVAPPTMIQAWTMKGLEGPAPGTSDIDPMAGASDAMVAAGYVAVVATNCEQRYLRYVKPGEKLHHRHRLESISDQKQTSLGAGYFLTQILEYCTEDGEKVAEMRFTILRYDPDKRDPVRSSPARPAVTGAAEGSGHGSDADVNAGWTGQAMTPFFDQVSVGDTLPDLAIKITPTLIVATAIASRDYQDVHHDKARAQELGSPDIFMNILTSNGLVGRYITDWAGPEAILLSVKIRLGAPNYPGDTMVMSGQVTGKREEAGRHIVEVAVTGMNSLGAHVSAAVELDLSPTAAPG